MPLSQSLSQPPGKDRHHRAIAEQRLYLLSEHLLCKQKKEKKERIEPYGKHRAGHDTATDLINPFSSLIFKN